jgi:hypothetical protein
MDNFRKALHYRARSDAKTRRAIILVESEHQNLCIVISAFLEPVAKAMLSSSKVVHGLFFNKS